MEGADKEFFDSLIGNMGAGIVGRGMYDAAGAWGGTNPFGGPLYVVTHRTEDEPDPSTGFRFVDGFDRAMELAREAAGDQDVAVGGGADVIRQALAGGHVDVLAISTAPVVLGSGKRLFEGFEQDLDLEKVSGPLLAVRHARDLRRQALSVSARGRPAPGASTCGACGRAGRARARGRPPSAAAGCSRRAHRPGRRRRRRAGPAGRAGHAPRPSSTSIARSPRTSYPACVERGRPALDQRLQRPVGATGSAARSWSSPREQIDRRPPDRRLQLAVDLAEHGDAGRVRIGRYDARQVVRRTAPARSANSRQCASTSGPAPPRAAGRRGRSSPTGPGSRRARARPRTRSAWRCSRTPSVACSSTRPTYLSQPVVRPDAQLGEPAAVQLLGERLERHHEVHLDPDQRVEGAAGSGPCRPRRGRASRAPRRPCAPRPGHRSAPSVPSTSWRDEPGVAVGAQQLVGGQPGLLGGRDATCTPAASIASRVRGEVRLDHRARSVGQPDVPDQLSSCHATEAGRRPRRDGELQVTVRSARRLSAASRRRRRR